MRTALIVLACIATATHAQQKPGERGGAYPTKPLRIIVTVPAAGSVDSVTRAMAQKMSERAGIPVIVDNRVGAITSNPSLAKRSARRG